MSARPQTKWREVEPLYRLSPQHDTTRPLDREAEPKRVRVPLLDVYAPELRDVTASPLVIVGTGDKTVAIGAGWKPTVPGQMSDEAITVQGWLLPRSKSLEPLRVRFWDWVLYAIAVGLLVAFAMRWL